MTTNSAFEALTGTETPQERFEAAVEAALDAIAHAENNDQVEAVVVALIEPLGIGDRRIHIAGLLSRLMIGAIADSVDYPAAAIRVSQAVRIITATLPLTHPDGLEPRN